MPAFTPSNELLTARAKPLGLATALWLFGIFTSVLLVGLWGRSVSGDQATLEESARVVLESELVNERVSGWLTEGLASASALTPAELSGVVEMVTASQEMDAVVDHMVDEAVTSALAPPEAAATIDLSEAVTNLQPAVSRALGVAGFDVPDDTLSDLISHADLVLTSSDSQLVSGAAQRTRTALTQVLAVGILGLLTTGAASIALSDDRSARVRSLAWRIALSAATFALMLRIGSWAVDPSGGRSPLASGTAVLLGSNGHVPLLVAGAATALALSAGVFHRRRRKGQPMFHAGPAVHTRTPAGTSH